MRGSVLKGVSHSSPVSLIHGVVFRVWIYRRMVNLPKLQPFTRIDDGVNNFRLHNMRLVWHSYWISLGQKDTLWVCGIT